MVKQQEMTFNGDISTLTTDVSMFTLLPRLPVRLRRAIELELNREGIDPKDIQFSQFRYKYLDFASIPRVGREGARFLTALFGEALGNKEASPLNFFSPAYYNAKFKFPLQCGCSRERCLIKKSQISSSFRWRNAHWKARCAFEQLMKETTNNQQEVKR